MTVSLDYNPESGPQGGISRLRRLASFGRYGADVHPSARTACSQVPDDRRQHNVKECSLLAASLSSFYGWVAKQTGSKVFLGEKSSRREQKLHVTQQVGDLPGSYDASPLHIAPWVVFASLPCALHNRDVPCHCRLLPRQRLRSKLAPLLSQRSAPTRLSPSQSSCHSKSSCHQSLPCR